MARFADFADSTSDFARRQALECCSRDDIIFPMTNTITPSTGHVRIMGPDGPESVSYSFYATGKDIIECEWTGATIRGGNDVIRVSAHQGPEDRLIHIHMENERHSPKSNLRLVLDPDAGRWGGEYNARLQQGVVKTIEHLIENSTRSLMEELYSRGTPELMYHDREQFFNKRDDIDDSLVRMAKKKKKELDDMRIQKSKEMEDARRMMNMKDKPKRKFKQRLEDEINKWCGGTIQKLKEEYDPC